MTEINILLFFMIAAAFIAMEAKDLVSSVVAIGAAGIALSMAFLALKAPDLAIMQLVVEILCLIILISATIRRDLPFSTSGRWLFNTISTLLFIAVFLFCATLIFKKLPGFGHAQPLTIGAGYLDRQAAHPETLNRVTAIADYFRVYDTLALATIVFTALIGVMAVGRRQPQKNKE